MDKENSAIKAAFVILLLVLLIALFNFLFINQGVKKSVDSVTKSFNGIGSVKVDSFANTVEPAKIIEEFEIRQKQILQEYSTEMDRLRKGIIDGNVITFMVSFVLVFLGGILFGIEKRAKGIMDESEKRIIEAGKLFESVGTEQKTIRLYTRIQSLEILSTNMQTALASNKYVIDETTQIWMYKIEKCCKELSDKIHKDKDKFIHKNWKRVCEDIFNNMIIAFDIQQVIASNPSRHNSVLTIIDGLEELKNKVSNMEERH